MTRIEPTARPTFTTFEESTAEDWQVICRQMVVSQERVADHVMLLLRLLESDHGGFPVTRLEHSLQTATRAERAGGTTSTCFCALVHDIGDTLAPVPPPGDRGERGAGPCVSDANQFMVEQHGDVPGLLLLAPHRRSTATPGSASATRPFFDRTAEFCARYDQVAFDPAYRSEPLEHFEPLVRAFFAPRG